MGVDHLFDFESRDVLATATDDVVAPPDEVVEPVDVSAREISSVKPQVAADGEALLRHAVVAVRREPGLSRAQDDLADLADRNLVVALVEQPNVERLDRPTACPWAARLVLGLEHDDSRVRQPVELAEPDRKPPLELRPEGGQPATPG